MTGLICVSSWLSSIKVIPHFYHGVCYKSSVPMSPAFALTEYKVLGSTYQNVVLDLYRSSKVRRQDASHKRYCSVYVQLTHLRSLEGLHLLQPLSLDDLNNQPHPKLRDEGSQLRQLADMTMRLEIEGNINGSEA